MFLAPNLAFLAKNLLTKRRFSDNFPTAQNLGGAIALLPSPSWRHWIYPRDVAWLPVYVRLFQIPRDMFLQKIANPDDLPDKDITK